MFLTSLPFPKENSVGIMVLCDRNLHSKILAFGLFYNSWDETTFASHAHCMLTGFSVIISQHKKKEKEYKLSPSYIRIQEIIFLHLDKYMCNLFNKMGFFHLDFPHLYHVV